MCTVEVKNPCVLKKAPAKKHHKKPKAVAKKAPALMQTPISVAPSPDCGEIHFPADAHIPSVVVAFMTSGNPTEITASDACMAKNAPNWLDSEGQNAFFSRAELKLVKSLVMVKIFPTTAGEHIVYVPKKFLSLESAVLTCFVPVRGKPMPVWSAPQQYSPTMAMTYNKEAMRWMSTDYADFICVDSPSYSSNGVATVYKSQAEMPTGVQHPLYYPNMGETLF
jgi:hypothetical protein